METGEIANSGVRSNTSAMRQFNQCIAGKRQFRPLVPRTFNYALIKIDKPLPPGYEKLKERYETDNRLRCLTIFILAAGPSQS